jgi:hypothetical protein
MGAVPPCALAPQLGQEAATWLKVTKPHSEHVREAMLIERTTQAERY